MKAIRERELRAIATKHGVDYKGFTYDYASMIFEGIMENMKAFMNEAQKLYYDFKGLTASGSYINESPVYFVWA